MWAHDADVCQLSLAAEDLGNCSPKRLPGHPRSNPWNSSNSEGPAAVVLDSVAEGRVEMVRVDASHDARALRPLG